MKTLLKKDLEQIDEILEGAIAVSKSYLHHLGEAAPNIGVSNMPKKAWDIGEGIGAQKALDLFKSHYAPYISATAGPNFYGYVTGGSTPAALLGDWLTSVYDQVSSVTPITAKHESDTIALYRELFGLPSDFFGSFVTGGTTSNMVNLAGARQWANQQMGQDGSKNGLDTSSGTLKVFAATPHSSTYKSLSILGMGRDNLELVQRLPEREAMDVADLEKRLSVHPKGPCIVVASAGTVNTGDFDDFHALGALKEKYNFWLHIDGAFGGFAAVNEAHQHLVGGWESADSIAIDAHKWLNVPYDAAFQFTKHPGLQRQVFQNGNVPYLEGDGTTQDFMNYVPENSRRWRSLPAWFTLLAYGKEGYAEIVGRNCRLAKELGDGIKGHGQLDLLGKVRLNIVCFAAKIDSGIDTKVLLEKINATNKVFLTPTVYKERFAIRVAVSNWRTGQKEINELYQIIANATDALKE
ncbi:aspartate aminotransferase family protein [Flagellimonas olearia]|uniref:Aspartate aminotransferase family protein n=1 Tax=Flagellimonas olearia TaxID=552546 RepID=A0A6I1E342_9FLAO|nr:pyridoxal-dependent decarboxylase [Allomuricauda olearia]KAB7530285.1 aspartate aminotransferase family protein [Allomuricauda olearia]